MRPKTPGWTLALTLSHKGLLPAGPLIPSASPDAGLFGAQHLHGRLTPIPLHLAFFRAYASSALLPVHLQGTIPGPWLAATWAGSAPARLRDLARPQLETFPFPNGWKCADALETDGRAYYEFRAALMIRNNEGLTKTYNRFHDPDETSPDIMRLRELHAAMDRAVLDAYGWSDIPTDCEFILDYEDEDEDENESGRRRKKPWRYRWPDPVRDEVLACLLALNAERAEEERLAGIAASAANVNKKRGKKKGSGPAGNGRLIEAEQGD